MGLISPDQVLRTFLEQGLLWQEQMTSRLAIVVWLMLVASAGTWIFLGRSQAGYKVTSVYWLSCGIGLWLCMYLPADWVISAVIFTVAFLSFMFTCIPLLVYKWRWLHAWPNRIEILLEDYKPANGLTTSITALSLVVFFLCLCYMNSWVSAIGGLVLGITLLTLVGFDYRPEVGLAGMILLTLSFVSGFLVLMDAGVRSTPTVMNLVLCPLAFWAFYWIWLGVVWRRQVVEGKALTTTAKLVHLTRHVGVMLLGFATLLGIKLALWPIMPAVSGFDNHGGRFVMLGGAFAVLIISNYGIFKKLRFASLAILLMLNIFSLLMGYMTRFPGFYKRVFFPHWPIVVGVYLILAIGVGLWVSRCNRRARADSID